MTNASPFIEDENQRDIRLRISERRIDWSTLLNAGVSSQGELNHRSGTVERNLIRHFIAYNFIECLLQENEEKRMSLTESLKHPWLKSYTPVYSTLQAYDTISSLDPQDFSMLSSMPGFDMNASVTTNLNGLQITSNDSSGPSNQGIGGKMAPDATCIHF